MTPAALAALCAFAALSMAGARALITRRRRADVRDRVAAYGYGVVVEPEDAHGTFVERTSEGGPLAALGAAVASAWPGDLRAAVRREMLAAGRPVAGVDAAIGLRSAALVMVPALTLMLALSGGFGPAVGLLLVAIGGFLGYAGPRQAVARTGRERRAAIERGMPELVDLMVVAVESGQSFGAALQIAAARVDEPLASEMRRVMREQSLGLSMGSALRAMAERTDAPSVRTFATTLVQGERLGISVGQMLRTLAVDIRKRRRAAAEEKAHKTPVKILFPLVLLIFPALFIVLLAPAVLSVLGGFGNG